MTDTQKYLRTLAEEVVSDISALEPFQCKELLGSFVAELFAVVAEEELREQRRQRQAEGIAEAKKKGVRLGRPPTPLLHAGRNVLRKGDSRRKLRLNKICAAERNIMPPNTERNFTYAQFNFEPR